MNSRKEQVLVTAKKLFIEKSFDATSIQDILTESKISKGTFYNYFSSKNECLMAILNAGRKETALRRQELMIGEDKKDATVLAKQISVRFQVNQEHNLLPIFESIFHSSDTELSDFAQKYHHAELSWLSQRLIDVYGQRSIPHAADCAILLLGMIQHMMHVWTTTNIDKKVPTNLVSFTVQQIDAIMPQMIANKQQFFSSDILIKTDKTDLNNQRTKEQLINELQTVHDRLGTVNTCGQQYIQFLIDELQEQIPRRHIIETVLKSIREDFTNTSKEKHIQDLVADIWIYLESSI